MDKIAKAQLWFLLKNQHLSENMSKKDLQNNFLFVFFSFLPQVYIERTRCLVHPDNDTELVDPMIGIYSFGKKQYTPAKKQVGMTDKFWGEHIFIEKNVSAKEEIKNGKVVIEVFDYNVLSKNALVGKKLAV